MAFLPRCWQRLSVADSRPAHPPLLIPLPIPLNFLPRSLLPLPFVLTPEWLLQMCCSVSEAPPPLKSRLLSLIALRFLPASTCPLPPQVRDSTGGSFSTGVVGDFVTTRQNRLDELVPLRWDWVHRLRRDLVRGCRASQSSLAFLCDERLGIRCPQGESWRGEAKGFS